MRVTDNAITKYTDQQGQTRQREYLNTQDHRRQQQANGPSLVWLDFIWQEYQ